MWHIFVMAASAAHWCAVVYYILPCDILPPSLPAPGLHPPLARGREAEGSSGRLVSRKQRQAPLQRLLS